MQDLVQLLEKFLKKQGLQNQPLLLALSGGSDSLCLFHCLQARFQKKRILFHVAHVDHAWRAESQQEAKDLRQMVERAGFPFHMKRLNPHELKGNLEAACREERYRFFAEICQKEGLEGVIVGHHADDAAETLLKKLFEGAHWSCLTSLEENKSLYGVRLLRPFLKVSKKEIQQWMDQQGYKPFEDATNRDLKFLRARLRERLIPQLSQEFGKEISLPLQYISQDLQEVKSYFEEKLEPILKQGIAGPFGLYLDFSPFNLSTVEIKYLIRMMGEKENIVFSRVILDQTVQFIRERTPNRCLEVNHKSLWLDRGRLFIPQSRVFPFKNVISLQEGMKVEENDWTLRVEQTNESYGTLCTSWKEAWKGKCQVLLPDGKYELRGLVGSNVSYQGRQCTIGKWWTDHQVPAFFRAWFPVIWKDGAIYHEFLTGKQPLKNKKIAKGLLMTLNFERKNLR